MICEEYTVTKIGVENIATKYHAGKLKIKDILTRNEIEFKKRGAQSNNEVFVVSDFKDRKYVNTKKEHYVVIDPKQQ